MPAHDISFEVILDAPKEKLYRGWTEPELMKQWFAPKPWTTPKVESDVRAGGSTLVVMRSPEGQDMPNPGQWLELIPNRKIVFTDAFTGDWKPKDGAPFFVAIVELEDAGPGKTKYKATARHWTEEARTQHEQMGFVPGWTICAKQLEALAQTL